MKILVTGATGMVGKGVLLQCLEIPEVTSVVSLARRSAEVNHPKFSEILHSDFTDFSSIANELRGFDACFHCMGVSVAGLSPEVYEKLTYDVSMTLGKTILENSPNAVFTYVSGQGTDSSEKGRQRWARVKGKTENDLLALGFKDAYMFRPGGIIPKRGVSPSSKLYSFFVTYLGFVLHIMKTLSPNSVVDTNQIGLAMVACATEGYSQKIVNPSDIIKLASS
jgi:uncharacterized protein YbjT (DUF2867 family)